MSISLSVASVLEKNRIESDIPFLALLDIEVVDPETGTHQETLRLALNSEIVVFNGSEYTPASFDISLKRAMNEVSTLELSINDYSQAIQAQMQAFGGGVGFSVTLSIVDGSALDLPAEMVEFFDVTASSASEYSATFTLGANSPISDAFPKRRQTKDFCGWRFKDGVNCNYVGPELTCDLTLQGPEGCAAKTAPGWKPVVFGAYPGINPNGIRYA